MTENPTRKNKDNVDISVIVSIYNMAGSVETIFESIVKSADRLKKSYEIVIIDDGSDDGSAEAIRPHAESRKEVVLLKMRSHVGAAAVLSAGLEYSSGKKILFYDSRVLINPDALPELAKSLESWDLVMGWRSPRRDALLNRVASWVFNRLSRVVQSEKKLHDINSGIFGTTRSVLEQIVFYGDLYNFIPVMAMQQGYRVTSDPLQAGRCFCLVPYCLSSVYR